MITYRCKCGKSIIHSSMEIRDCEVCNSCGSTFATHPDHHAEPVPHEWEIRYSTKTGEPEFKVCINCNKHIKLPENG